MFKRLTAGVATLALALGMVAVTAAPAEAHHNTIAVSAACTSDYQYVVTWTITNSENISETITQSSNEALVPVGTVIGPKGVLTKTQTVSSPADLSLNLTARWDNGTVKADSNSIKAKNFPECAVNHVPVTICHATPPDTAAQGWHAITIDDDAIVKSAHNEQHDKDIIPAFSYWEKVNGAWTMLTFSGKNLTTDFGEGFTGQEILDAGCATAVTPANVEITQAQCIAPGQVGQGSYVIPSTPGVQYFVNGSQTASPAGTYYTAVNTTVNVVAKPTQPWITLTGTTSWKLEFGSPGDCIYSTTPVKPAATDIAECGVYGSLVLPTTEGVKYTLTVGDGKQGPWTVVATPLPGWKFADGQASVTFTGDLGEYTKCATPVAPTATPITECGVYGSLVLPTTEGVKYTLTVGDGKQGPWTVVATPTEGYSFKGDQSVTFTGDLGKYTDCAVPVTPGFTDSECTPGGPSQATYTVPAAAGVQYLITIGEGETVEVEQGTYPVANGASVVIEAKAKPGYTLKGQDSWSHEYAFPFCPPTLASYEVGLQSANQVCTPTGLTAGSVTVTTVQGPADNPVPAVFVLNKGQVGERVISGTTALAPGDYTVTASPKLAADSVYASTGEQGPGGSWMWNVRVAPAFDFDCFELPTLAYTGEGGPGAALWLGLGALGLGAALLFMMRRREDAPSA
jgi:LPXTG-motif cell wall-anchored protein